MKTLPDFDTLKELAEKDPEALERLREEYVQDVIDSAPPELRRRLQGLQFQIDAQRRIHTTPLSSCMKLSQMMYKSFNELRYLLNEMTDPSYPTPECEEKAPADILEFTPG